MNPDGEMKPGKKGNLPVPAFTQHLHTVGNNVFTCQYRSAAAVSVCLLQKALLLPFSEV